MSEGIQPEQQPSPGERWTEIVRRPTLEEFSRAFTSDVVLEASVGNRPIVGPAGLWVFFQATRAMYEQIAFTHEIGTKARMCLEWEGVFASKPVAGATIITRDDLGAITSVRLYYRPFDQVVAFAGTLSQLLEDVKQETAPVQFVDSGGIRFAYRRFGRHGGTPLLLLNYFAANLDQWDPKVTNGLAAERDVILLDYPGVGSSSGETPSTVAALTKSCLEFCRAIDLTRFDLLGFSLGGMIAQQLAASYPEMVRRIILSGTGPRGGEGMVFEDLSSDEMDDEAGLIMNAFFTQSESSKAAGRAYIERTKLRVENRDAPVSKQAARAEAAAIREWGAVPQTDRFAMLGKIQQPTLIVHGSKDVVILPINAFLLAKHLPNAQLIMYPDASHAAYSQYAKNFLENARLFLNG